MHMISFLRFLTNHIIFRMWINAIHLTDKRLKLAVMKKPCIWSLFQAVRAKLMFVFSSKNTFGLKCAAKTQKCKIMSLKQRCSSCYNRNIINKLFQSKCVLFPYLCKLKFCTVCENCLKKKRVYFIMSKTCWINCCNNTRMSISMSFSLKEHNMETCVSLLIMWCDNYYKYDSIL